MDYSRQNVNSKILKKLIALAKDSDLTNRILAISKGDPDIEQRRLGAGHMLLRSLGNYPEFLNKRVKNEIDRELEKFLLFSDKLRNYKILGWKNNPIKNVVVLGLGGSILGPKLVTEALRTKENTNKIKLFFISNPDCCQLDSTLNTLQASETFFLIQSKSFKTPEILILKNYVSKWMKKNGCSEINLKNHFSIVTANLRKSKLEGFLKDFTFKIWDWVGGRFSVWSSVGLPLAISIGPKKFREFLNGARIMDQHFLNECFESNLPVISGLLSIWNRNFLNLSSYAVVTYSSKLDLLVNYIQQLDMESLGKNIHSDGQHCEIDTGQIVWGGAGIEGQHAYFQLLHQGKHVVPVDFYGLKKTDDFYENENFNSSFIISSLEAQADSLFWGDKNKNFEGNRPSSIFLLDDISPATLGSLLAMQEHRVFVMANIWNINAFDQPGVELGKKLLLKRGKKKFE